MTLSMAATGASVGRRWTPLELGSLSLWLDADDSGSFTLSGSAVSQWNDRSGNANHVSQGTSGNRPARVENAQNGLAVVRFDGNDILNGPDALDLGTGGISVGAAFKNNSSSIFMAKSSGFADVNGEWVLNTYGANLRIGNANRTAEGSQTTGTPLLAWVVNRTSATTTWRNGTQIATTSINNTDDLGTATIMTVGGFADSGSYRFNGDMYEIVVALASWSTDDRQRLEGYLAHKWGLTGNLPADHPHKTIRP